MDHRVCVFIEAVQTSIRRTDLTVPAEDNVQELDLHGVPTNTIGRWEAAEGLCHVEESKKPRGRGRSQLKPRVQRRRLKPDDGRFSLFSRVNE